MQSSERRSAHENVALSTILSRAPPLWRKQPQAVVANADFFYSCYFYVATTTLLSLRVRQDESLSAGPWWRCPACSLPFLTMQVESWRGTFFSGGPAVCHRAGEPSDHRGQVGVCQALRQTVCPRVPGESSASLHSDQELTFCLFAAPRRRNAGSQLAPLFRGVYSPCRSAAGPGPAPLSDGTVDPAGMENAASKERERRVGCVRGGG